MFQIPCTYEKVNPVENIWQTHLREMQYDEQIICLCLGRMYGS